VNAVIELHGVSRWYGQVVGINDVTLSLPRGVIGLLGPNGAGKSTFLKLVTGQIRPSTGSVTVLGEPIWDNPPLMRRIGFCPEQDAFYDHLTGRRFVETLLGLHGYDRARCRGLANAALDTVEMQEAADRRIAGYSKGMRQRIKVAQALAHDPEMIFLDEPLNGMDPLGRRNTVRLIREWGAEGRTVVVSSHILHEVEAMTQHILLVNQGRIVAEGDIHEIRGLIDEHPHRILIGCDRPRVLAARLMDFEDVLSVRFSSEDGGVEVATGKPDQFYGRLPEVAERNGVRIDRIDSQDDNLQAVFDYLVR
jgi:ABC-2 type transport system ATP-binding protein